MQMVCYWDFILGWERLIFSSKTAPDHDYYPDTLKWIILCASESHLSKFKMGELTEQRFVSKNRSQVVIRFDNHIRQTSNIF